MQRKRSMGAMVIAYSWQLKTEGTQELWIRRRSKFHIVTVICYYKLNYGWFTKGYYGENKPITLNMAM